ILARGQEKAAQANEPVTKIELVVRTKQPSSADALRDRILTTAEASLDVKVISDAEQPSASLVVYPHAHAEFGFEALSAIGAGLPVLVSSATGLAEVLLQKAPQLAALHIAGVQRNMSADATNWSSRMHDELTHAEAARARARRLRFALLEAKL